MNPGAARQQHYATSRQPHINYYIDVTLTSSLMGFLRAAAAELLVRARLQGDDHRDTTCLEYIEVNIGVRSQRNSAS